MSIRQQIRAAMAAGYVHIDAIAKSTGLPRDKVGSNMGPLLHDGMVRRVNLGTYAIADWPEREAVKAPRQSKSKKAPARRAKRNGKSAHFTISPESQIVIEKDGKRIELTHAEVPVLHEFLIHTCPVWERP